MFHNGERPVFIPSCTKIVYPGFWNFEFFRGTPPSCLKVGLQDSSVSPGSLGTHLVLELIGTWLGLCRGQGLTKANFPDLEIQIQRRLGT